MEYKTKIIRHPSVVSVSRIFHYLCHQFWYYDIKFINDPMAHFILDRYQICVLGPIKVIIYTSNESTKSNNTATPDLSYLWLYLLGTSYLQRQIYEVINMSIDFIITCICNFCFLFFYRKWNVYVFPTHRTVISFHSDLFTERWKMQWMIDELGTRSRQTIVR